MKNDDYVDCSAINRPYERRRNNAKRRYRCREGLKQLFLKPVKIIPILFLIVVYIVVWYMSDVFITYIITSSSLSPFISYLDEFIADITTILILIPVITYFVKGMVSIFFLLLLIGLLSWLGKPRRAKEIEDDVAAALIKANKDYYKRPFLISSTPINGGYAMEYAFYSRWISLDRWKNPEIESDILSALNCHRVEEYKNGGWNGNNRRIIVLCAASGANPKEREAPEDPLFKN